jgi:phosphohistidine swiveling domain-containing protein
MAVIDRYLERVAGQDLNFTHNFTILCSSIKWNIGELFDRLYPGIAPTYFFGFTKDEEDLSSLSWMHPKNACEVAFNIYWKNPDNFYAWLSEQKQHIKEINAFYNFLTTDYINNGKFEDVKKQIMDLVESERACNAYGWFSMYGEVEFYKECLKKNRSSISSEKVDQVLGEVSNLKINSFDQRNTAFIKQLNFDNIEDVYDKCEFMFSNFNGIPKREEILAQLKEMSEQEVEEFTEPVISTDTEEGKLKQFVYESMKMRDSLRDYVGKTIAVCYRLTKRVAREAGMKEEHIDNCLLSEVFLGVEKFKDLKEDICKRKNGFTVLFNPDGSIESEYGTFDETYAKMSKYVAEYHAKDINSDELKGTTACKGKVKGRAKIIMHLKKDAEKFNEGDILITGMTRPEYVPLMKKSVAVVTNEGGITCHAAIVSREMGIPCIIGTKVASEVFKDGDLIEVDADKGIARKINEKEKQTEMNLPTEEEALGYFEEYKVPRNIKGHCVLVRDVAVFLAKELIKKGEDINLELVSRAALLHDLFKVIDIKQLENNVHHPYVPSQEEIKMWKYLKEKYSGMHEDEVFEKIFGEQFPELTKLILEAGGLNNYNKSLMARIVRYADVRILRDKVVNRKERKEYLLNTYPENKEIIFNESKILDEEEPIIFNKLDFKPEQLAERMKNG